MRVGKCYPEGTALRHLGVLSIHLHVFCYSETLLSLVLGSELSLEPPPCHCLPSYLSVLSMELRTLLINSLAPVIP